MSFRGRLGLAFAAVLALAVPAIFAGLWGFDAAMARQARLHRTHESSRERFHSLLRHEEAFAADGEPEHTRAILADLAAIRSATVEMSAGADALRRALDAYEAGYDAFALQTVNLRTLEQGLLRESSRARTQTGQSAGVDAAILVLQIAERDLLRSRSGLPADFAKLRSACDDVVALADARRADPAADALAWYRLVARLNAYRETLRRYEEARIRQQRAQDELRRLSLGAQSELAAACRVEETAVHASLERLADALYAIAFSAIAAALLATWLLSSRIAGPLRRLRESAERLAAGDLAAPAVEEGGDEIGALGRAFHRMAGQLRAAFADLSERNDALALANAALERHRGRLEQEARERAAALAEAKDQLHHADKLRAIGQLAGGVAHDFNNELGGIIGYADLLRTRCADDRLRGYAVRILEAADRVADLIGQLQAFSRRERQLSVTVNLHRLIDDMLSILRHTLDRRIEIRTDLRADPPTVLGDPGQLQAAFLHIAANADAAMPEAGVLTISTALREIDGADAGDPLPAGRYVEIAFTDTGIGMDAKTRERIFEPFFTTKGVGKGAGLGLSAVHGTVRTHLGSIRVQSEPGRGTTFAILLPWLSPASAATVSAAS